MYIHVIILVKDEFCVLHDDSTYAFIYINIYMVIMVNIFQLYICIY